MRLPPPIVIFPLATALVAILALALRSHHDAPAVAPLPPKRSSTISPRVLLFFIARSASATGFCVG
jgi:hypothetical protein